MNRKPVFFLCLYALLGLPLYGFGAPALAHHELVLEQDRAVLEQDRARNIIQTQGAEQQRVEKGREVPAFRQVEIRTHSVANSATKNQLIAAFKVEIADTPQAMQRGLMFRTDLADDEGMLFIFPTPRRASFWMRNTVLPLDMIFIKADGIIETIVTRHDTQTDRSTKSQGAVAYVLEINAGIAEARGIKAGQRLHIHPAHLHKDGL